jgi:hypothetical protein
MLDEDVTERSAGRDCGQEGQREPETAERSHAAATFSLAR